MPLTNEEIASVLYHIADILEDYEENIYRVRAYRRAANSIKRSSKNISALVENGDDLTMLKYIGAHLANTIKQIVLTKNYVYEYKQTPPARYPIKLLNKKRTHFFRIYTILPIVEKLLHYLINIPSIHRVDCSGDVRRKKDTIEELTFIVQTDDIKNTFSTIQNYPGVRYILKTQRDRLVLYLKIGIHLTIYAVTKKLFGTKLLETTGSLSHVKKLHQIKKTFKGETEKDIYAECGLEYIPPELREDQGEIDVARKRQLPTLIELNDIKGDLHCHTNETDGTFSLTEMVYAAKKYGYEYIAITDHSKSLKITNGMDEKRLLKQIKQIDLLNEKLCGITILKSMEVDILENGELDISNDVLKELDLTVCSIHSKFRLSFEQQTERVLRAMDNPYFNILGHATGRLLFSRPPYDINIDKILQAAKERNCFIEVNAQPARLDINDIYCRKAKQLNVKVAISSDAHTLRGLTFMILGVNQARRGWLEAKDVINTYALPQLKKILKRN